MDKKVEFAASHRQARAGWQSGEAIVLGILSVPLLIALMALAYRSTLFIPINYNEGWNAFHAEAAAAGGRLYYPADALVTNNYPPLSFLIVGALTNIVSDAVFAGRLVVWIGFLGAAVLVNAILRRLGNDWVASAFGAIFFLAYSVVHFPVYVGTYDPQWLAHAAMLFGLAVFPQTRRAQIERDGGYRHGIGPLHQAQHHRAAHCIGAVALHL